MDFVIVVRQGWLSQMERARLRCRPVCMAEWLELEMNLTWFSRFGFLLRLPYDDKVFQTHNWKLVNWACSVWLFTKAGKVPDFLSFECNIAFGLCVTNISLLSLNVWHFIKKTFHRLATCLLTTSSHPIESSRISITLSLNQTKERCNWNSYSSSRRGNSAHLRVLGEASQPRSNPATVITFRLVKQFFVSRRSRTITALGSETK